MGNYHAQGFDGIPLTYLIAIVSNWEEEEKVLSNFQRVFSFISIAPRDLLSLRSMRLAFHGFPWKHNPLLRS